MGGVVKVLTKSYEGKWNPHLGWLAGKPCQRKVAQTRRKLGRKLVQNWCRASRRKRCAWGRASNEDGVSLYRLLTGY